MLSTVCIALAICWLVVLPAVSKRPQIQERLQRLESRGIDPAAMFYTDLEVTGEVVERFDAYHRKRPRSLWIPKHPSNRH